MSRNRKQLPPIVFGDIPVVAVIPNGTAYNTVQTGITLDEQDESKNSQAPLGNVQNSLELNNEIYHKSHFADRWLYITLLFHFIQFSILLSVGYEAIGKRTLIVLVAVVFTVPLLLIIARCLTQKAPRLSDWRFKGSRTPEDETDQIPDSAVYILVFASILEGFAFTIFPVASARREKSNYNSSGLYSFDTMVQTLRFASITLYGFHRLLRPANRLDPMRTMLELEVVSVCWDAIDGSTVYQLIGQTELSTNLDLAARVLMCFWYISVGVRLAMMFATHLSPSSFLSKMLLTAPLHHSKNPIVDRSLQAIQLRSVVTIVMSLAEFYAGSLRIALWSQGLLDLMQQEMMIKNILFLVSVVSAYSMWSNTKKRAWNQRRVLGILKPSRPTQLQILRFSFALTYFLIASLLTSYLIKGQRSADNIFWIVNLGIDILLTIIFLFYCRKICEQKTWIVFPGRLGITFGCLLISSLFGARLPALYMLRRNNDFHQDDSSWSYNHALFVVSVTIIPIACYSVYWSVGFMLFYPEYTKCPGDYNAIHDPVITVVSVSTMTEGALDILSCASLMGLAPLRMPLAVHGAVIACVLLEVVNACQCFALQALLAGVLDDTPAELVRWKANLRAGRSVIDFLVFVVRIALWVKYDAVSSVFLVKNIYNMLHGASLVERAAGIRCYNPRDTMFMGFVPPEDWYGMTSDQWREVTGKEPFSKPRPSKSNNPFDDES